MNNSNSIKNLKIINRINEYITKKRFFYSFEYFPPKTPTGIDNLFDRIERMSALEPLFMDITWSGGMGLSAKDKSIFIATNIQNNFNVPVLFHLASFSLTKSEVKEILTELKNIGIVNILALRGDKVQMNHNIPPKETNSNISEDYFGNATELVRFIREQFGDFFCIGVAGYPEKHPESPSNELDIQYLKNKVEAGADFIITQLFYDCDLFLQFLKKCKNVGINVPILPGIMPINGNQQFTRITDACGTSIPDSVKTAVERMKSDDAALKCFGIELGISMCKKLLDNNVNGLHFYTLNLERSVAKILEGVKLLHAPKERKLPWTPSYTTRRSAETVRPIFWANRPLSYLQRTMYWDEFPNGRWGDARSPAFGRLTSYHLTHAVQSKIEDRQKIWGSNPTNLTDIYNVFVSFLEGKISKLPWCELQPASETTLIASKLIQINKAGLLTINSQPAADGISSEDPVIGWGGGGGYVYQKAYLEFFCSFQHLNTIMHVAANYKSISYNAVNAAGTNYRNCPEGVVAVTWGVFPNKEVLQPTVVDSYSFQIWKDEAFELWLTMWASLYPKQSPSRQLIENIHNTFFLVNIIDNDYKNSSVLKFLDEVVQTLSNI